MARVSIIIHQAADDEYYEIADVCSGISISMTMNDTAGKMTTSILDTPRLNLRFGDEICVSIDSVVFFVGKLFTREKNLETDEVTACTFYDYTRYFKNPVSYSMPTRMTFSEAFITLCKKFDIPTGTVEDTGWMCNGQVFNKTTIGEIFSKLQKETLTNTGKTYVWRQYKGKICLLDVETWTDTAGFDSTLPQVIGFTNTETIDERTYNEIEFVTKPPKEKTQKSKKSKGKSQKKDPETAKQKVPAPEVDLGKALSVSPESMYDFTTKDDYPVETPTGRHHSSSSSSSSTRRDISLRRGGRHPTGGGSMSYYTPANSGGSSNYSSNANMSVDPAAEEAAKKAAADAAAKKKKKSSSVKKPGSNRPADTTKGMGKNGTGASYITHDVESIKELGCLRYLEETDNVIENGFPEKLLFIHRNPTRTMNFTWICDHYFYYPGMRAFIGVVGSESIYLIKSVSTSINNDAIIQDVECEVSQDNFATLEDLNNAERDAKKNILYAKLLYSKTAEQIRTEVGDSLEKYYRESAKAIAASGDTSGLASSSVWNLGDSTTPITVDQNGNVRYTAEMARGKERIKMK